MEELQTNNYNIIDRRVETLADKNVISKLTKNEKKVLISSAKTMIKDLKEDIIQGVGIQTIKDIAIIVGCSLNNIQLYSRSIINLFVDNYEDLTFSEITTAFELLAAGQLDMYLANPNDKNHYQQLSPMYISTILKAYQEMRRDVFKRIEELKPTPMLLSQNNDEQKYIDKAKNLILQAYDYFKQNSNLPKLSSIDKEIIYNKLNELGIAEEIVTTEDEKKMAYSQIIRLEAKGLFNSFRLDNVKKKGLEHEDVITRSYFLAREKAIKNSFAKIDKQNINLEKQLKH